jgi:hypothetical protein
MKKTSPSERLGAVSSYSKQAHKNMSLADTISRALLKCAGELQDLHDNWDTIDPHKRDAILKKNRDLWMIFYEQALEKSDMDRVQLCHFVMDRTMDTLTRQSKTGLTALIHINKILVG